MRKAVFHSSIALAFLLVSTLFNGCASSVGLSSDNDAFASATAHSDTSEKVLQKVKAAFIQSGFKIKSESDTFITFEKEGDKSTSILYGTSWNTEKMMIEPRVEIKSMGSNVYQLNCEVFIREYLPNNRTIAPWQVHQNGKRKYQKLMNGIKENIESK